MGGTSLCKEVPPKPPKKLYCPWFSGSPQRGEPENHGNEKFLERGLGRNLFSKRFSPDYFFETGLVLGWLAGWAALGFLSHEPFGGFLIIERNQVATVVDDEFFGTGFRRDEGQLRTRVPVEV
jgi:hypothetical protein